MAVMDKLTEHFIIFLEQASSKVYEFQDQLGMLVLK